LPPGDSPIPSVSSGSSSPLSATSAPPTLGQPKGGSASQDRKIPPPIGTERLARIRQGGSVAQAPVGTSFVAPVGHSGIWSFGVNAVSGRVTCPLCSNILRKLWKLCWDPTRNPSYLGEIGRMQF
jgi:hypothetical protein